MISASVLLILPLHVEIVGEILRVFKKTFNKAAEVATFIN